MAKNETEEKVCLFKTKIVSNKLYSKQEIANLFNIRLSRVDIYLIPITYALPNLFETDDVFIGLKEE